MILIFVSTSFAKTIVPGQKSGSDEQRIQNILTNIFYDEIYKRAKDLKPEDEVKKVKFSINDGRRGKMIIEMLKQKNREKIARMRGLDPKDAKSGESLIAQQREKNKEEIATIRAQELKLDQKYAHLAPLERKKMIWKDLAEQELRTLGKVISSNKGWRKKHKVKLEQWEKDYTKYVGKIDEYKGGLTEIPIVLPIDENDVKKEVETTIVKDFYIIPSSLSIGIRDQGRRPTCSSFAGIRAIETLLYQNSFEFNLSEQHFYWASKPNCRTRTCVDRGSWVGYGLEYSKESPIPLEKDCPYKESDIRGNDTQIPLLKSCREGRVRVESFSYVKSLDETIARIKNNQPVIAGFKLTPNFYDNRGLILDNEKNQSGATDDHASGHAVLLIGYMKLPKVLAEGKVCFIVANSWGTGWGHGGYSCLSEKWAMSQRRKNPFVSIDKLTL